MGRKSVDYGMIGLEVVALSCLAGIAYLLRDYFDKVHLVFSWALDKSELAIPSQEEDRLTHERKKAAKTYWERYWDDDLVFLGCHVTRYRIVIWFIGLIILVYLVNTLSK